MKNLKFDLKIPLHRLDNPTLAGYCATYGLTLVSFSVSGDHELEVEVAEDVTPARHQEIATSLSAELSSKIVTAKP